MEPKFPARFGAELQREDRWIGCRDVCVAEKERPQPPAWTAEPSSNASSAANSIRSKSKRPNGRTARSPPLLLSPPRQLLKRTEVISRCLIPAVREAARPPAAQAFATARENATS